MSMAVRVWTSARLVEVGHTRGTYLEGEMHPESRQLEGGFVNTRHHRGLLVCPLNSLTHRLWMQVSADAGQFRAQVLVVIK